MDQIKTNTRQTKSTSTTCCFCQNKNVWQKKTNVTILEINLKTDNWYLKLQQTLMKIYSKKKLLRDIFKNSEKSGIRIRSGSIQVCGIQV